MKLAGLISEGSGKCNEDAAGVVERDGEIIAAWVFDGVTGINDRNYVDEASDAAWFVARAEHHLLALAAKDISLPQLLEMLVNLLVGDWQKASAGMALPNDHDMPAACLLLVKRYDDGWKALRLGDSFLLTANTNVRRWDGPLSDLGKLEALLRQEAKKQRADGVTDFKDLLQRFRPKLLSSRQARNTPGNHSILVPDQSALVLPEFIDLGSPESMLLCTDGFYRVVDTYGMMDDAGLVAACIAPQGIPSTLRDMRLLEAADPHCEKHLRFKPTDDASAIMLHR